MDQKRSCCDLVQSVLPMFSSKSFILILSGLRFRFLIQTNKTIETAVCLFVCFLSSRKYLLVSSALNFEKNSSDDEKTSCITLL